MEIKKKILVQVDDIVLFLENINVLKLVIISQNSKCCCFFNFVIKFFKKDVSIKSLCVNF